MKGEKYYMIIPIDTEKAFNKIQHTSMIKTFNTLGREGSYLNIIKITYEKSTIYIILKDERQSIFSKNRKKKKRLAFATFFNIVLEVLARAIRQEKEIKGIQIEKAVKLALFMDNMYIETLKNFDTNIHPHI